MMADSLSFLRTSLTACRRCLEAGHDVSAPPIFSDVAGARVMIVGQAPGRVEAQDTGLPFSGPAGKRLFRWLAEAGWSEADFRAGQALTAITKCYPGPHATGRGDRVPGKAERDLCRPWLEQELAVVQPAVVVPVGGLAIRQFLGNVRLADAVGRAFVHPEDEEMLTRWARQHLPPAVHLVPLPHPSGASLWLNEPAHRALVAQALVHLDRLRQVR